MSYVRICNSHKFRGELSQREKRVTVLINGRFEMSADECAIDELPWSEVGLQRASIRERARADSATRTNEGGEERWTSQRRLFRPVEFQNDDDEDDNNVAAG